MTFAKFNLNPLIFKAINACGYDKPTPIQAQSIPSILLGKDLLASAPTGTGKTAAFILPMLHHLSDKKSGSKPRALILTPTRELALQISNATLKYGKFLRLNTVSLVGGVSYHQQLKGLSRPTDIIIATPGRLLDHMENRKVDLSAIEMLILDEADRMLDMGFIDDIKKIAKKTPTNRQTLLLSATIDTQLKTIINQLLKNPVNISLTSQKTVAADIKQELYRVNNAKHKMQILQQLLAQSNIYKAIIFSATKINADRLVAQLIDQGYSALALHGNLKQNVRNRNLQQLRTGKIQFLVATDVAARGIDIADISHVINFDFPKFHEDYVHRIGRTGRAGRSGIAISLGLPEDLRQIQRTQKQMGIQFEQKIIEGLEPSKQFAQAPAKKQVKPHKTQKKPFNKNSKRPQNKKSVKKRY